MTNILDRTAEDANEPLFTMERFLKTCNEAGYNMMHAAIIHKQFEVIEKLLIYGTCKL